MKTQCQTEGHYFYRTMDKCSRKCTYCPARRWPWTRESVASIRAFVVLRKAYKLAGLA